MEFLDGKFGKVYLLLHVLVALLKLISLVENQFFLSDVDLEKVSDLRAKYLIYFNKLEKLWVELNSKDLTEDFLIKKFHKLK